MPLFRRPESTYQPKKNLPNHDAFVRLKNAPLTAKILDALANYIIDVLNDLSDALDKAKAGVFPGSNDPENKDKIIYSDGITGQWGKIIGIFMDKETVTAREIKDREVKKTKIDFMAVGEDELDVDAVTSTKVKDYSLPPSKLRIPTKASIMGGIMPDPQTNLGGTWKQLDVEDYQIVTKVPGQNGVSAQYLSWLWDRSESTFDGGKLDPDSIVGSISIKANSTPLGVLKSSGTTVSIVCGKKTDQKFTEVTINDLEVISVTSGGNAPSSQKVSTLLNNELDGVLKGGKLKDDTVLSSALKDMGKNVPFAMGYILSDGTIQKSKNIAHVIRTGTGTYDIEFTKSAPDNKYIVTTATRSVNSIYLSAEVDQNKCFNNGFTMNTGYMQSTVSCEFYFVVYAF